MKLTILGSGTYQPELERHSSAYLLEIDGQKICFDFGRGAIEQLLKLSIRITELDAVFISHWHGDHIADLIPLLHYTIAPLSDDISELRPVRTKALKIYGPKGTSDNIRAILNITRYGKTVFKNFEVKELSEDKITIGDYQMKSFLANHKPGSLCYRLEAHNKILAYSGDSIDSEGLRNAIRNADLAMVEASWPAAIEPQSHLDGPRVGQIAQEEGVKKLVLTHMAPYYLKNFNPVADAKKYFKGEVILAKDLMAFDI